MKTVSPSLRLLVQDVMDAPDSGPAIYRLRARLSGLTREVWRAQWPDSAAPIADRAFDTLHRVVEDSERRRDWLELLRSELCRLRVHHGRRVRQGLPVPHPPLNAGWLNPNGI